MKKTTKKLLMLVCFLVVLIVGYFALDYLPEDTGEEEQNVVAKTIEVTEFHTEDIVSYAYQNSDYAIGFEVTDGGYVNKTDADFPVNVNALDSQLEELGNLTALQSIESADKVEYGLDSPRVTIAVTLADGTERSFQIGDSALFEAADYLLDVENDTIYLISQSLASVFTCAWSNLVQKEEMIVLTTDQIMDVTVETDGEQTMYIAYDETKEKPWQLTTPEGTFDGDSDAVTSALGKYNSYSVKSVVEYNCTDFSRYGLEEPATVVTVRYTEEEETEEATVKTLVFEFGNKNEEESGTYVRINGSPYVYTMTEYYVEGVSVFDLEELKFVPEEMETAEE